MITSVHGEDFPSLSIHRTQLEKLNDYTFTDAEGVGCLGLGMIGCLKLRNPAKLVVLDINDQRLELAKKFGADIVMNPAKEKITPKIMELTEGYGCDVYIEASGHPSSVQQGLDIIRKLGRFVEFSVFGHFTTADWSIINQRNSTRSASFSVTKTMSVASLRTNAAVRTSYIQS